MIIFRQHPRFFLGLKCTQIILAILILAFELTQFIYYGEKLVQENGRNDWFDPALNDQASNGQTKIWVITVCALTIISHVTYVFRFINIWNKGPYAFIELLFLALWLTSSLSNLDPIFRGLETLNCRAQAFSSSPDARIICGLWTTSIAFGWITFGTYFLSFFFSWQARKENQPGIGIRNLGYNHNNQIFTSETLQEQKKIIVRSDSNALPITVITVPQNIHQPPESEKEIPQQTQLLLQSGLPDQGIPLQIVLPQSDFQRVREEPIVENHQHHEMPQLPHLVHPQDTATSFPEQGQQHQQQLQQPQQLQQDDGNSDFLNVIPSRKPSASSLHEVPL
ncbi:13182_t:CDS:2 [Acaulospora morrowiae]|uniref:13182_t:CDS:1 n=1 Tax=Acaulospora morrowiae TaxID=94023 RepID=A0A9N8W9L7_9GLOM|nr:13182_t:CDS:2 [Acaulospora morrowiae]